MKLLISSYRFFRNLTWKYELFKLKSLKMVQEDTTRPVSSMSLFKTNFIRTEKTEGDLDQRSSTNTKIVFTTLTFLSKSQDLGVLYKTSSIFPMEKRHRMTLNHENVINIRKHCRVKLLYVRKNRDRRFLENNNLPIIFTY